MIASLTGVFKGRSGDSAIVDVSGIGYLVFLPPVVWDALSTLERDQPLELTISYQVSAQQPRPTLFGFLFEEEKEFFELLASVPRMGGRNAARAMVLPVNVLANAIQESNSDFLDRLPGVSSNGAEKIIANLRQKVASFAALERVAAAPPADTREDLKTDAIDLLVMMDVKKMDATRGVEQILESNTHLSTVQDVVTEFFKRPQRAR